MGGLVLWSRHPVRYHIGMAQGRIRRLATQFFAWAWIPVVAFVLVVAVAMGCAVWSPLGSKSTTLWPIPETLPSYAGQRSAAVKTNGFGISIYYIETDPGSGAFGVSRPRPPRLAVGRAGFPLRCMRWTIPYQLGSHEPTSWEHGVSTEHASGPFMTKRRIPLMPEPVGMTLNVLIVSASIVLVCRPWRGAVVARRRRKNLCIMCAYPVGDLAICPECGKPTGRDA